MRRIFVLTFTLSLITLFATAQKRDSISNEELVLYATMMDSVESIQKKMSDKALALAKGNSKISAARYTLLLPLAGDQKKLAEAKATPDEIAYINRALAIRSEEGLKLSNTFQELKANYVGFDLFNRVKAAIASDPTVKKRYETMMAGLKQ